MATMQLDVMIPDSVADGAAVLTIHDVAHMTDLSLDTLKFLQLTGDGPAYTTKEPGCVRYSAEDVREFKAQRSR